MTAAPISQIWYSVNGGAWNADATADPTTSTGGYPMVATEGQFMGGFIVGSGSTLTANFGASAFAYSVPTGFYAGFPNEAITGYTTFDPATIWSIVPTDPSTLSNGNLTLTTPGLTHGGVATVDYHTDGKFYFELTVAQTNFSFHVGPGVGRKGADILSMQAEGAYDISHGILNGGSMLINSFPNINQAYVALMGTTVTNNSLSFGTSAVIRVAVELHSFIPGQVATAAIGIPTPKITNGAMQLGDLEVREIPTLDRGEVTLRWSDDAGASWSSGLLKSLGDLGEFRTDVSYRRLGMARNRIFEVSWSGAIAEALQGVNLVVEFGKT